MRFTQFLEQNSTPEWQRAYIDYRACTRQIRAIAARISGREVTEAELAHSDDDLDSGPARIRRRRQPPAESPAGLRRRRTGGRSTPQLSLPSPASAISLSRGVSAQSHPRSTDDQSQTVDGQSRTATADGTVVGDHHPVIVQQEPSIQTVPEDASRSGRSIASDRPDESPSATLRVHNASQPRTSLSSGSASASADDPDEVRNSFMAAGSVRDEKGVIKPGGLRDENDLFSPSAKGAAPTPQRKKWPLSTLSPNILASLSPFGKSRPKSGAAGDAQSTPGPRFDKSLPVTPRTRTESARASQPSLTSSIHAPVQTASSLDELYDTLYPDEYHFFEILDHERDKVEGFYSERIAGSRLRFTQLRDQLDQMRAHEDDLRERYARWESKMDTFVAATTQMLGLDYNPEDHSIDEHGKVVRSPQGNTEKASPPRQADDSGRPDSHDMQDHLLAHETFLQNKRSIMKAIDEFYRYLEMLKNYRVVNLLGFCKALKKFEATTRIACLDLYNDESLALCSFSNSRPIDKLLKETEDLYARYFTDGNLRMARSKLRVGEKLETFYNTTYRGGVMIGMGLPPAVLAIVKYFDEDTRVNIPARDALLVVYSALYLPVFFVCLFQLNLDLWVRLRINYQFVMEITRPCLDHRCYHEIPAFLFMTLSYCFFFSFYRVAPESVAPTTWPIAWMVFTVAFFLNPLPICRRRSRWWYVRALGHVVTPGFSSVKFVVFFIADILNSMTYSIQNIYFLGCVSVNNWPATAFKTCASSDWPFALLACLAPLARLIQCLRRWWETRLPIHLLNGGKYTLSILAAILQVWNRSRGFTNDTRSLVVWIIFATLNSIATCSWDLVVDWSLLRPGCKGLRPELIYPSNAFYYAAMVYNILIRFVWIWVIPVPTRNARLRGWIFALLEVLRRWIWGFFRVETEHIGNSDSYRAVAFTPLPYRKMPGEQTGEPKGRLAKRLSQLGDKLVGNEAGRGFGELNVGAFGRASQREYEARRPGDDNVPIGDV